MTRVYYLFCENPRAVKWSIDSFLEVRVTEGSNWKSKVRGRGQIKMSNMFSEDLPVESALIETKRVFLLNESMTEASLSLVAGISFDKEVKRTEIKGLIKAKNGIYFTDPSYISSDLLPTPWLELFASPDLPEDFKIPEIIPHRFNNL